MKEDTARTDTSIFLCVGVEGRPLCPIRDRRGRRVNPRLDAFDQVELPCAALNLPDAERREARRREQRQPDQQRAFQDGAPISAEGIGIMLLLRWYMIHSDPASTITTSTAVKI